MNMHERATERVQHEILRLEGIVKAESAVNVCKDYEKLHKRICNEAIEDYEYILECLDSLHSDIQVRYASKLQEEIA